MLNILTDQRPRIMIYIQTVHMMRIGLRSTCTPKWRQSACWRQRYNWFHRYAYQTHVLAPICLLCLCLNILTNQRPLIMIHMQMVHMMRMGLRSTSLLNSCKSACWRQWYGWFHWFPHQIHAVWLRTVPLRSPPSYNCGAGICMTYNIFTYITLTPYN